MLGFLAIEHSTNLEAPVLERLTSSRRSEPWVGKGLLDQAKALRPDGIPLGVPAQHGSDPLLQRHGFSLVKLTDGAENTEREPDALYRWP